MKTFGAIIAVSGLVATGYAIAEIDHSLSTVELRAGEQFVVGTGPTTSVLVKCGDLKTKEDGELPSYPRENPDSP